MLELKLINSLDINNDEFEDKIKILFKSHFNTFLNCGKHCQHIIDLWKLSLDNRLIDMIKILGINNPIISTRPVLFSNSKHISKSNINHTVPAHQDWSSMQGSINSIICWVPLIDISIKLGSIELVPESHINGLLSKEKTENFGLVNGFNNNQFISCNMEQGDVMFFSSFLIHRSGTNETEHIRWSTHFRYNDLDEKSFVERGYSHAYIYRPVDEYLTPEFDTKTATKDCFENT